VNTHTKIVILSFYRKRDITINPQYEILAKCLLPEQSPVAGAGLSIAVKSSLHIAAMF
jgi:hypothetical protein